MDGLSKHIKIKKKKSPKNISLSQKYRNFLINGGVSNKSNKTISPKRSPHIKVVKKGRKVKKVEPVKKEGKVKKVEPVKKEGKVKKVEPVKKEAKKVEPVKKAEITIGKHKHKGRSKHKFTKNSREKPNNSKRRRLHKRHTRNRRVSFRCTPRKNKDINKVLKSVDQMSDDKIKKELLKQGIEIKSNKKQLLKDIYLFSSMGGINVHKE